jgi:hypothetical protein
METLPAQHLPASSASRHRMARVAVLAVATATLVGAGVAKRPVLTASVALLGHLRWVWVPAAVLLELASLVALAGMQRRLLAAGGTSVGVRPMLATTFAANAVSVSVPLAGPELGTLFTFRRLTRQGADGALAGWSLLAGGMVSRRRALAAVLLYRLISFWLAAGAGWLVFLWLRRHRLPEDAPSAGQFWRPRPVPGGCCSGVPS